MWCVLLYASSRKKFFIPNWQFLHLTSSRWWCQIGSTRWKCALCLNWKLTWSRWYALRDNFTSSLTLFQWTCLTSLCLSCSLHSVYKCQIWICFLQAVKQKSNGKGWKISLNSDMHIIIIIRFFFIVLSTF